MEQQHPTPARELEARLIPTVPAGASCHVKAQRPSRWCTNGSKAGEVNHFIPTSNGILNALHVAAIGAALWLFLYYIDKTTCEQAGYGLVYGGKPCADDEAARVLGVPRSTVARWRKRLEKYRYIAIKRTGVGYIVSVAKSKKFTFRNNGDGQVILRNENLIPINEKQILTFDRSRSDMNKDSNKDFSSSSPSASEEKSSSRRKNPPSEAGLTLARRLRELVLENNPEEIVSEAQTENWAREADRMIRVDGRTQERILEVIEYSQHDSFWWKNVQSMKTLSKQFGKLTARMKGEPAHATSGAIRTNARGNRGNGAITPEAGKYDGIPKTVFSV